jgi:hypothetical protein
MSSKGNARINISLSDAEISCQIPTWSHLKLIINHWWGINIMHHIESALVLLDEQRFPNSSMTKSYSLPISRYRTLGLVGRGQFGRVFCARSRKTGEIFALKELEPHRFPNQ